MTDNKGKGQSIERDPEITQMGKSADKDLKTVINTSKDLKENMNIINRHGNNNNNQITSRAEIPYIK